MIRRLILFLSIFGLIFTLQVNADPTPLFKGILDAVGEKMNFVFHLGKDGLIKVAFFPTEQNQFKIESKIDHIQTSFFEISTVLESSLELIPESENSPEFYRGSIKSRYSLIDLKPVPELSGHYEIKKGKLLIRSLYWGQNICEGYIGLLPPYDLKLKIKLVNMATYDFFRMVGFADKEANISGKMTGVLEISGFLDKPMVKGSIKSVDGIFEELEYDNIVLNFEGLYPFLNVRDSVISQTNGLVFGIEGTFDLARMDSQSIIAEFSRLTFSPLIDESMERHEWTIKRKEEQGSSGLTEFKYRLNKNNSNTPFEDEADMLGVERSIKF